VLVDDEGRANSFCRCFGGPYEKDIQSPVKFTMERRMVENTRVYEFDRQHER
jgi:hypothetical protein